MGTRNLTCVVYKCEYKIAQYGQWDGYPEGQGITCLKFLREQMDEKKFKEKLGSIAFYAGNELPELYIKYGGKSDGTIRIEDYNRLQSDHPELGRDIGAGILELVQESDSLKLENELQFAADSLFCEWAYVIDFDKNTFEVYEGFNQRQLEPNERFYGLDVHLPEDSEYRAVRLVKWWQLDKLPTKDEFLNAFKAEDDDDAEGR